MTLHQSEPEAEVNAIGGNFDSQNLFGATKDEDFDKDHLVALENVSAEEDKLRVLSYEDHSVVSLISVLSNEDFKEDHLVALEDVPAEEDELCLLSDEDHFSWLPRKVFQQKKMISLVC